MDYDGPTPSKASLQQMFAKEFKAEPNHVEISKIISETGKDSGKIWVKIWEEKEIPIYTEKGAKKEEGASEEKPQKPAEAPAEAPSEEPKEEKKEEKPEEPKEEKASE